MIKKLKFIVVILLLGFYTVNAQQAGYYNGTEGKTGSELKSVLHGIINQHVDFSYSDAKYILNYADSDPANENNIICIYTRRSQPNTSWGSGGDFLNREHVWAKSHGDFEDVRPMDGDAFNLHPADASVNITRSNYDFDECSGLPGATLIAEANAWYTTTQFEPQDAAKGEVARTLFYMAVRYEGTDNEIDLEMIDQVNNYPNPKFGKLSTLLQWNNDFPPTPNERRRNERVFEAQRNRNPFIDHPEYANMIWNGSSASAVSIGTLNMTPVYPVNTETATVSAAVSSTAGSISSAILYYGNTYNSEEYSYPMNETGGIWSGELDFSHFTANEFVYFKITASDGINSNSATGNYRLPEPKTITPISTVQGTGTASGLVGNTVTVAGIITANLDNTLYIQASDEPYSGMCVFDIRRGKLGDTIVVTGNVSEYNNLTEIDNVSYVFNYGHKRNIDPKILTISQVNEDYEGMLVTIKNVTFLDGDKVIPLNTSVSLQFSDATGSMIVYARYGSRISGKVLPSGVVDVTGVISQYAGTYQLLVNDISDITGGPDNQPPMIAGVKANDKDWIEVSFNEKLDKSTAEIINNYSITNGLTITGAYLYGNTSVLLLVTGLKKTDYTLTINGVSDLQGNTMTNATGDFHSDFEDPAFTDISCINDTINVTDKSLIKIYVIANDALPTGFNVSISKLPAFGIATVNPDFSITYETLMGGAPVLRDTFIYEICNSMDPLRCGQASVYITDNFTKQIICNNDSSESTDLYYLNINVLENDTLPSEFNLSISRNPKQGYAIIENDLSISYYPYLITKFNESLSGGYILKDTIIYQVCYLNAPEICLEASVFITMDIELSINYLGYKQVTLYPVPVINELRVKSEKPVDIIEILDLTGKIILKMEPGKSEFTVQMSGFKGVYFVHLTLASGENVIKKVIKL